MHENNINIKSFWQDLKTMQSLKSYKSHIPISIFLGDISTHNLNDISQLFANHFSSVYTKNN